MGRVCVCSTATTAEVIGALLTKFNIVDNVMKFALYQRSFDDPRRQLGTYTSRHLPKAVTRGRCFGCLNTPEISRKN